ncbi:hypothetical protein LCGC14_3157390, partial [marine sediment metagenome]
GAARDKPAVRLRNFNIIYNFGLLFAAYLVFAGAERFLVEFVRRNDELLGGLTMAQLESIGLMLVGGVGIALAWRRGALLSPAT